MQALLHIPAHERTEFAAFGTKMNADILNLLESLLRVDEAPSKVLALKAIATEIGMPESTFRRKYYAWKKRGWKGLVNWNKVPTKLMERPKRLNNILIEEWKRRCENVQRNSMHEAWATLMRDIRSGTVEIPGLPHWTKMYAEDFPGRTIPAECPTSWIPKGLTYNNLLNHKPTKHELITMRQGRKAAAAYRPLVCASRVGLKVGQIYVCDDMWHDHLVNFFGAGQRDALRPLELHAIDLASTYKVAYGLRPRLRNDAGAKSKHDQIKDREARQLVCHIVCMVGYRRDGTVLNVEHGTAAISTELEEYLAYATDGLVTVDRGGIDRRAILDGAFEPRGVGNFRFKASLESLGGYYHNVLAQLPGQVGLSRDRSPENLHTLEQYNAQLLKAVLKMDPERAIKLWFPVINWHDFVSIVGEIYERIANRTDHNLSDWQECGYIEEMFLPAPGIDPIPMRQLMADPEKYQGALMLAHSDPARFCTAQKLSPSAVWNRGRGDLVRVDLIHAPAILGPKNAYEVVLNKKNEAILHDNETHTNTRYSPELREFDSPYSKIMPAGQCYFFYPVPGSNMAVVCDMEHRPLGWTAQFSAAYRADKQSCLKQHGEMEHVRALMEAPMRARHEPDADQIRAMKEHNRALLPASASAAKNSGYSATGDDDADDADLVSVPACVPHDCISEDDDDEHPF